MAEPTAGCISIWFKVFWSWDMVKILRCVCLYKCRFEAHWAIYTNIATGGGLGHKNKLYN